MRFFNLLGFQYVMLIVFPTLIFIIIFSLFLGFSYFRRSDSKQRMETIIHKYPEGIEGKNAPFPVAMMLVIAGVVIWAFFYILMYGLLKVAI